MNEEYIFCCVLKTEIMRWQQIANFLQQNNLNIDTDIEQFIVAFDERMINGYFILMPEEESYAKILSSLGIQL